MALEFLFTLSFLVFCHFTDVVALIIFSSSFMIDFYELCIHHSEC